MKSASIGLLKKCECCPRKCGANRIEDETGFCGAGADIRISHAGLHFGEEPPISGSRGSGTIFFWGCNLRCAFCQNHQISQGPWPDEGQALTADELATVMIRLQEQGAHNVNLVSPSHVILQAADAIVRAKEMALSIPIVYNSNGYDSVESLRRIRGLVDIYLPDLKYMEGALGKRFSEVEDYADTAPAVIEEMLDQVGRLELDDSGIATRGTLVRHLVLPGHLENSRKCLRFLADIDPNMPVSIMSQYSPQHKARFHPEINRALLEDEYEKIMNCAIESGLENAFVQEMESQSQYLPDFRRERPFDPMPSNPGS